MATRPAPRPRRHRPAGGRAGRPAWLLPAVVAGVVVVAAAAGLIAFRSARPGALPGTVVGGVEVGGLEEAALRQAVATMGADRAARRIDVQRGPLRVPTSAGAAGYAVDVDATVDAVLRHGRQLNPLAAMADHLTAGFTTTRVRPVEVVDDAAYRRWVIALGEDLGLDAVRGEVLVAGSLVEVLPPPPGEIIDAAALRDRLLAAVDEADTDDAEVTIVDVPTTTATPSADEDLLARLAADVDRAISAPVTLTRGEAALTFTAEQIGDLLAVRAEPVTATPGAAALELVVDPSALAGLVGDERRAALSEPPRDAVVDVRGDAVQLVGSSPGFAFDAVVAADQLLEVATSVGPRTVPLEGENLEPEVTTAELEALGIREVVATYTTEHACCEGRVTNIQRMADLVDGAVVGPGETFSLNAHVGPRTTEAGFVDGGAISGGEFTDQIGGGVSQFATTLFNAVFFGGYEILEFKPHSYYIPRYPVGREATLNFDPPIDVAFRNDSPHGIYVATSHTDTSVTVALVSTTWAEVESTTSERYGIREPREERTETDELDAGDERVAQGGRPGFSVDITRTIRYVDGREEVERFTTTYLPEPRIIEVGTGAADGPTEPPEDDPTDDAPDDASGEEPADPVVTEDRKSVV